MNQKVKATQFTFPSDREVVTERVFDAARERVFKAYTDPNLIPQWWRPRRHTTVIDRMDVRPGGVWRYVCRGSGGEEFAFNGVFREIVPPEKLVSTFEFEGMPDHGSIVTAKFEERAGETKLIATVVYQTIEDRDGDLKAGMEEGASESWDRLA